MGRWGWSQVIKIHHNQLLHLTTNRNLIEISHYLPTCVFKSHTNLMPTFNVFLHTCKSLPSSFKLITNQFLDKC
ncbi:hypothetical protein VIGAN_03042700, partial [Vigna angularis var. angularis]